MAPFQGFTDVTLMGFTHRWWMAPLQGCTDVTLYSDGLHPPIVDSAFSGLPLGVTHRLEDEKALKGLNTLTSREAG